MATSVTTTAPFTKSFAQIRADYAAAAQAASQTPLDFTVGSIWLALAEATGGNVDWLQKLFLFALSVARLTTSQGNWVDTFTADYMPPFPGTNSPRLPALATTGIVTFSRHTPQAQAIVPVGALVASFDGKQIFQVLADTTNPAYSATIIPGGGFIIPAGQASVNITVTAVNPGAEANVQANTITQLQTAIVGVDSVTNPVAFATGADPESDTALKLRFQAFIQSLSKGTPGAIDFAVRSLQQGLQDAIHENIDPNGATDNGSVVVYVDDGSGMPTSAVVSNASKAIGAVRAAGVRVAVLGASRLAANISMTIVTGPGYYHPTVVAAVANAVTTYVNGLGLETPLRYTELAHVAYSASAGVINVTNVLLNGGTADLIPSMGFTIKIGTLSVQ